MKLNMNTMAVFLNLDPRPTTSDCTAFFDRACAVSFLWVHHINHSYSLGGGWASLFGTFCQVYLTLQDFLLPIQSYYKSFKTKYKSFKTHNNLLNHENRSRKNPARSMMNQRQHMFQLYVTQLNVYNRRKFRSQTSGKMDR